MPNGMYGGVRGRKMKVGRKLLRFPPTRLCLSGKLDQFYDIIYLVQAYFLVFYER